MVLVTTSVSIIFYFVCALASLRLMAARRLSASVSFAAIAVLAALYSAWAFYGAGIEASLWSLAMTAAAVPVYLIMRAINSRASSPAPEAAPAAPLE
jgi:APA family basic amino acid/polyamine antiporter